MSARRSWTIVGAAGILGVVACGGGSDPHSTAGRVYTAAQAARGKDIYLSRCTSCHNLASHTGSTFRTWWAGRRLSEMYEYIGINMPKNNPGTLSEQETADVMAYILQLNAMPNGPRELPADSAALYEIRIEVPKNAK